MLNNKSVDPYFNLALEEYLVESKSGNFFLLWRNERSVVVGKNQNALAEIDPDFVEKKNISVIRRMSGGGAVFHDPGNVNFSFITETGTNRRVDFREYLIPIIDTLSQLGIKTELSKYNDILADGLKISGNAQYIRGNRLLHHGTLLFDADLAAMKSALRVRPGRYIDRAVKSRPNHVINLREKIRPAITVCEFMQILHDHVLALSPDMEIPHLTPGEIAEVKKLAEEKYKTWEWNYGKLPRYEFKNSGNFNGRPVEVYLSTQNGIIDKIKINGDSMRRPSLEQKLRNCRHQKQALSARLDDFNLSQCLGSIGKEDFIKLLL